MSERSDVQAAARDAARAKLWLCDDGHRHRRPEWFTLNRLRAEMNRRNPGNPWMGSTMGCAIYDLIDSGELEQRNRDLKLRPSRG